MSQELFDWALLLGRWIHITVAITWVGTSIFFMWLDRTLIPNTNSSDEGHAGELWMVHGGGFYHVEKKKMGPTKVPEILHWFKWESYWTWMSGAFLIAMIFYTGEGTFLLDPAVAQISYGEGLLIGLFSIFGSWIFYDFIWERDLIRRTPMLGHLATLIWFAGASYFLCHTLSGRAAFIHVGAMLGTWMAANVFMRIIPRQIKMVEAAKAGETVNQSWGLNAKNRSTHNTYLTLPVIFIMLSNHFPATYGHSLNWLILLLISGAGAALREYFVVRLSAPRRSKIFGGIGILLLMGTVVLTTHSESSEEQPLGVNSQEGVVGQDELGSATITGIITLQGDAPKRKWLKLPASCTQTSKEKKILSNHIIVNKGRLKNTLVRITKGLEEKKYTFIPEEIINLDQRGCLYYPKVLGLRKGQRLRIINSDATFHNVRSVSQKNKSFNLMMPQKNQQKIVAFNRAEIFLETKCDVHPWMGAYIAVVDHPFFAVSNDRGEFTIPKLPSGDYTLEAWHQVYGTLHQKIHVSDNQNLHTEFIYKP